MPADCCAIRTAISSARDRRRRKYGESYAFKMYQPAPGSRWKLIDIHDFGGGGDGGLSLGVIRDTQGNLYGTTFDSRSGGGVFYELSPADGGKWTETVLARLPFGQTLRSTPSYAGKEAGPVLRRRLAALRHDGRSQRHARPRRGGFVHRLRRNMGVHRYLRFLFDGRKVLHRRRRSERRHRGGRCGQSLRRRRQRRPSPWRGVPAQPVGRRLERERAARLLHFTAMRRRRQAGCQHDHRRRRALYGTTSLGGVLPCKKHWEKGCEGVVFKLTPDAGAWDFSVLATFCKRQLCADGARPSQPVLDSSACCSPRPRSAASPTPARRKAPARYSRSTAVPCRAIYAFCRKTDCTDGQLPNSAPVVDPSGNIFGTTQNGGAYGDGVAFELSP